MNNGKTKPQKFPMATVHFVFLYITLILSMFNLFVYAADISVLTAVCAAATILALISAYVYFMREYGKEASVFYKIFLYLYLAVVLLKCIMDIGLAKQGINIPVPAALRIVFGVVMILVIALLAVKKDLGRTVSFVLTGILLLIALCMLILTIVRFNETVQALPQGKDATLSGLFQQMGDCSLACSAGLMVCAKYFDKRQRGRD